MAFCEECGQPIEFRVNHVRRVEDNNIVQTIEHWVHVTARTYPELNDHEVVVPDFDRDAARQILESKEN